MHTTPYHQPVEIARSAAGALAARRQLQDAAFEAREELSHVTRSMLARFLKIPPERFFAAEELAAGSELLALLEDAVSQAGGAPVVRHTEEGDRYTEGGTESGRRIGLAADTLSELLRLAWSVSDHLSAEAAMASQRFVLSRNGPGTTP